jgi:hypothetical protein
VSLLAQTLLHGASDHSTSILPIETAGKRGYRTAEAQRLADAARLAAGETAWAVQSRIRTALLQYLLDLRERDLSADEAETLAQNRKAVRAASECRRSFAARTLFGAEQPSGCETQVHRDSCPHVGR